MRKRTKAREYALKILYQMEMTKDGPQAAAESFWEAEKDETDESVKEFTGRLVNGVAENIKNIDSQIAECAANWQVARMAVIDRNIIRMAAFEMLYCGDIPPKVSINEAIDIAKKYGDNDSGKFVNGILDKINKTKGQK